MSTKTGGRGFTIVELLVVIGIIGLLVTIALVLGGKVSNGQKASTTANTIRVLDMTVDEIQTATDSPPEAKFVYTQGSGARALVYEYSIVDGRQVSPAPTGSNQSVYDSVGNPVTESMARYSALCGTIPTAQAVMRQIDQKFIRTKVLATINGKEIQAQEYLDGWREPIRVVHPAFDGGWGGAAYGNTGAKLTKSDRDTPRVIPEQRGGAKQNIGYRRSMRPWANATTAPSNWIGDGDEGLCPNKRMYFYSGGADKNPGTREDNVYAQTPQFPSETATAK